LGGLQIFNFVITLITLPYLARVLGVSAWGLIVFVQLVVNYLIWVTNWGFYHGATRRVSAAREDGKGLSIIFSRVWCAQWILTGLILTILLLIFYFFSSKIDNYELYIAASGLLIGNLFMPLWYLNGIEFIKEAAIIQLFTKLLALPFIFLLVHNPEDAVIYLWINSVASIVVGIIALFWMSRVINLSFSLPTLGRVKETIYEDFQLFLNTFWASLNTTLIPAALSVFGGDMALGYYNIADRAKGATITILHPISHALFPRMCYLFSSDHSEAKRMLNLSAWLLIGLSFFMSLVMYVFAEEVVMFLGGEEFIASVQVLKILAFSALLSTISSFIVNQVLIPSNAYYGYTVAVFVSLVFSAVMIFPMVTSYGVGGAALVTLLTEFLAMIVLIIFVKRHKFFSI
jgi:O-antigen/teichoic acid export membrane protein